MLRTKELKQSNEDFIKYLDSIKEIVTNETDTLKQWKEKDTFLTYVKKYNELIELNNK